ncbi:MAG TPA: hypothetical protein VK849_07390, partial [Longimicrobiales bacterium]|nr:hypothetical protein [Longimicrobiales bacterium]
MSIESLKEQARSHEQREDWRKALDYYRKAIARLEKADQPDIGLYNRVGDIFVRVADLQGAVKSYERAVDLYVEAGLHNNAIAVCKKIVRSIPRRHEVFLRMGQIRAEQGFISDARTSFLTYAERMQQNGNLDESFRALVEFCDLAPDEAELRVAVGEQMAAHERVGEAVPQLLKAYHDLERLGRHERAREVRSRILELDPGADFTRPPEPGGAREAFEVEAGHDGVEEAAAATATGSPMDGFERTALSEEPDDEPRSSLEDGDAPVEALAAAVEEAEASDWEDDGEATELPLIEVPEDEDPSEALREAAGEYEGAAEDLPFLEFSDEDREGVTGGRTEASSGNEDGIAVLDVEELRERIAATPDDVSLRQRALEIAYQGGESAGIVEAFLGLAGALDRTGDRSRAEVAYRQVLQMDPGNAEA